MTTARTREEGVNQIAVRLIRQSNRSPLRSLLPSRRVCTNARTEPPLTIDLTDEPDELVTVVVVTSRQRGEMGLTL